MKRIFCCFFFFLALIGNSSWAQEPLLKDLEPLDREPLERFLSSTAHKLRELQSSENLEEIIRDLKPIILESHETKYATELLTRILINQAMVLVAGVYQADGSKLLEPSLLPKGYYTGLRLKVLKESIELALKYYTHDQKWIREGQYADLTHSRAAFDLLELRSLWAEAILDLATEQKFLTQSFTLFENLILLAPSDERNVFAEELIESRFGEALVTEASEVVKARERLQSIIATGAPKVGVQPRRKIQTRPLVRREVTESKIFGLVVGDGFICVIQKSNGEVLCLGDNFRSKLGVQHRDSRSIWPKNEHFFDSPARPGVYGAVQLASHGEGTCALTRDGLIKCWGPKFKGASVVTLQDKYKKLPRFASFQMGSEKSCGVDVEGRFWCWDYSIDHWWEPKREADGFHGPHLIDLDYKILKYSLSAHSICAWTDRNEIRCGEIPFLGSMPSRSKKNEDGVWEYDYSYAFQAVKFGVKDLVDLHTIGENRSRSDVLWVAIDQEGELFGKGHERVKSQKGWLNGPYVDLGGQEHLFCAINGQSEVECDGPNMNYNGKSPYFDGDKVLLKEKAVEVNANTSMGALACAILVGNQISCWAQAGWEFREKGSQDNPIDMDPWLD